MVLLVLLEVLGERLDLVRERGDLNLGRSRIAVVTPEFTADCCFVYHFSFPFLLVLVSCFFVRHMRNRFLRRASWLSYAATDEGTPPHLRDKPARGNESLVGRRWVCKISNPAFKCKHYFQFLYFFFQPYFMKHPLQRFTSATFNAVPAMKAGTLDFSFRVAARYGAVDGSNGQGIIHGSSALYSFPSRTSNRRNTMREAKTSTISTP